MSKQQRKKYVQLKWLLENYVTWSEKTLRRRMEDSGFPYIQDEGGPVFDLDEVDMWFKKRKVTA